MNLTELLQNDLPLFTPDQTIGELHDFFEEYELTHIGICDAAGLFIGLLSAADIRDRTKEMSVSDVEELLRFERGTARSAYFRGFCGFYHKANLMLFLLYLKKTNFWGM